MNNAVLGIAVFGTALLDSAVLSDTYNADISAGGGGEKETVYLADDEGIRILDDEDNYIITT